MFESFQKNKIGIVLMLLSSICVCLGQLFWKLATGGNVWLLMLGFGLYGIGALIMLVAYRFGDLSVLQPILSFNYILSVALAALVLNEYISTGKIVAVLFILAGVILIGGSK